MGLNSPLSNPLGQELGMEAVTASECVRAQRFHPPRLRHGKERGGGGQVQRAFATATASPT